MSGVISLACVLARERSCEVGALYTKYQKILIFWKSWESYAGFSKRIMSPQGSRMPASA